MRPACVLFDLDNTLFDHRHSLHDGMTAVQSTFPELLGDRPLVELVAAHESALRTAYRVDMRRGVPSRQLAVRRTALFLDGLGIAATIDAAAYDEVYEAAYRADRRATGGSVELIARLRDAGVGVGVVTDGATDVQREKLEAIELAPLVDELVTSEEAGVTKPDALIFATATARCGVAPGDAVMIGDDLDRDVAGALAAGLAAIHYLPESGASPAPGVPTIARMREAIALLAVAPVPSGLDRPCAVGIDLVTEPRHCSAFGREDALVLRDRAVAAARAIVDDRPALALGEVAAALLLVGRCARILDVERIELRLPAGVTILPATAAEDATTQQRHSTMTFAWRPPTVPETAAVPLLEEIQAALDAVARDHPRAAMRALRRVAVALAERLARTDELTIAGEGVDEQ